jgi:2-polyprenyl-6-methoxyphenol hydroxylase-like FAD-dependent oxidoreductase
VERDRIMIETTQEKPILVAGGGIGGLATALALAKKGAHVRVLEQSPQFAEIGAGIQLGPNVFRMFEWLGITQEINRLAVYPENLIMRDCITGQEVTRIALNEMFLDRFKYPYALIHRADLHSALLEACRKSNLIGLHTSQKVATIAEHPDRVAVKTEQGEEFEGIALVGADGIWSTIRSILVGDGKPRVSGHICYRAVLPTTEMPEDLRIWSMMLWAGEKTHFVHYPVRGGELFNLVAVFHSARYEEGWDSYGDPKELHERFAGTCSQVKEVLAKIESWRMWVLCDREPIRNWSRGRVTLLGDAAHPMLQYLAQGACMAIEDSVVLANKLDAAKGDVAGALLAYQNERYIRTGRVQLTARLYGEAYHAAGAVRDIRNVTLAARTPQQALDAMGWLYDGINPDA